MTHKSRWPLGKPSGPCRKFAGGPEYSSSFDHAHEPEQNARAYESHHDGTDQSAGLNSDQAEDPAAHQRTDDADDDVHQHVEAAALHYFPGKEAGDETYDAPPEQATDHERLPLRVNVNDCTCSP